MPSAWEKLDLEGSGLQSANRRLKQRLKRRVTAYILWILFPLGAHRFYLGDWSRALLYMALSTSAVIVHRSLHNWLTLIPVVIAGIWAAYDLVWIDRRVTGLNKQARMAEYLHHGNAPPPGFRGHYTDDADLNDYVRSKEAERGGHSPTAAAEESAKRAPSFAEQEKLLRELTRRK